MSSFKKITIQAKDAQAFDVGAGQRIRICTPKGYQAADFFAYNAHSIDEAVKIIAGSARSMGIEVKE